MPASASVPIAWGIHATVPSIETDPSVGRSSPAMQRSNVDLPTPFTPTIAACRPLATRKDTSAKSSLPPGWA